MKVWIARNKIGDVYVYWDKPIKGDEYWLGDSICSIYGKYLPEDINPQWSDDEPIEVEVKLERVKLW